MENKGRQNKQEGANMGHQDDHGLREQRQRLDPKKTMRARGCTQYKKPGNVRQQEQRTRCAGVEREKQAE